MADHQTLEVGDIDILFREIRGACSLLICAAENETHQLDAEGMYFVANAIQERITTIQEWLKPRQEAGDNDRTRL